MIHRNPGYLIDLCSSMQCRGNKDRPETGTRTVHRRPLAVATLVCALRFCCKWIDISFKQQAVFDRKRLKSLPPFLKHCLNKLFHATDACHIGPRSRLRLSRATCDCFCSWKSKASAPVFWPTAPPPLISGNLTPSKPPSHSMSSEFRAKLPPSSSRRATGALT